MARSQSPVGSRPRYSPCCCCTANEPVSADKLAIALWGEDVAGRSVQDGAGARLAAAEGARQPRDPDHDAGRLPPRVRPDELDAARFEELVRSGRQTLANGEAAQASDVLREALTLWRGPPLADFASEPFAPRRDRPAGGAASGGAGAARGGRPRGRPARATSWPSCSTSSPSTRRASSSRRT